MEALLLCLGAIALITAFGVVSLKNPVHCAVSLIGHMISLAAIFVALNAEFLAMVQVIVYAGAVVVLFLFIIAYLGKSGEEELDQCTYDKKAALILVTVLALEVLCLLVMPDTESVKIVMESTSNLEFGSTKLLAHELYSRYLIPFELASILLLVAAVGVLALVRRSKKHKELHDQARELNP